MDEAVELALKEEVIKSQSKVVPRKMEVKGVEAIVEDVHLEADEAVEAVEPVLAQEKVQMERYFSFTQVFQIMGLMPFFFFRTKGSQMPPTMRAVLKEFTMTQRNRSIG
jgi:hypothetical protein